MENMLKVAGVRLDNIIIYTKSISEKTIGVLKNNKKKSFVIEDDLNKDTKSNLIYINEDRFIKEKLIYLTEWKNYKVESLNDNIKFHKKDFKKRGIYGNENFGLLKFKNRVGFSMFKNIKLYILSPKMELSQVENMIKYINEFILNLSYSFNEPTSFLVEKDLTQSTDLKYHQFLAITYLLEHEQKSKNIISLLNYINENPHKDVYDEYYYERLNGNNQLCVESMVNIVSSLDNLMVGGNSNILSGRLSIKGRHYIPKDIKVKEVKDTYDTSENRFLKFFIVYCISILDYFYMQFKSENHILDSMLIEKTSDFKNKLYSYLKTSFLNNVGDIRFLPFNSQVLLKKEGYRQIFDYFFRIKSLSNIAFDQDDFKEIIENKDISLIYEYYVFMLIADIISDIYQKKLRKLNFKIKKNSHSKQLSKKKGYNYFEFINDGLPLIKLYYNKTYSDSESYSKEYTPDISLEIFDKESLKYIFIFDSKYRLSNIDVENTESLFKETSKTNEYNNEDIDKMHCYKDAINGVLGSFVLYPGDKKEIYHEIQECKSCSKIDCIFKYRGVGAFPVVPSNLNDYKELKGAIQKMLTLSNLCGKFKK